MKPSTYWKAVLLDREDFLDQKDLADIARIIEAFPDLEERVPRELLDRLL